MQQELNGILGHIDQIQALDLDGVAPTSHVIALRNVLRADVPRPSVSLEAALHHRADRVVHQGALEAIQQHVVSLQARQYDRAYRG